ncbi:MAG TPA: PIN domain-containing protein [Candidatus Hydrogenedentes bacterium]|nr:PIN domain-containing protein [Candidatus Hydrogenedentota bacterium]HPG65267.1 PIN domain-containing protein [Candidatus Hydrogenedentota bacterium]
MSVGLLDVNVLIALAWPSHVHHREAHAWFAANRAAGWATCPLTQSAFVRVSSNPRIIPEAVTPLEALALLHEVVRLDHHVFWPDDMPFDRESLRTELLVSHRQVNDAYLLGLAIRNNGKLVTFDRGIAALLPPESANRGALEILASGD